MIEVLEPQDRLLQQFVDSVYLLRKDAAGMAFTAYPTANLPVGLFRNTCLKVTAEEVFVSQADSANFVAVACNQLQSGLRLHYLQLVDEIAINFKPLGFASFSRLKPADWKLLFISAWDEQLPALFDAVFATDDPALQLQHIEQFLLAQYAPLPDEAVLLQVVGLLNDTGHDYKMQEIADLAGLNYKRLYRLFKENVGCSLKQYHNLVRFRTSVASKINQGPKIRLVDICYDHGYTDQSHFIRQFRMMTGERPARFFRDVSSFGKDKVIFKLG